MAFCSFVFRAPGFQILQGPHNIVNVTGPVSIAELLYPIPQAFFAVMILVFICLYVNPSPKPFTYLIHKLKSWGVLDGPASWKETLPEVAPSGW